MKYLTKDLWGELSFLDLGITPFNILMGQASLLDEKTNNMLKGEVLNRVFTPPQNGKEKIAYTFNIVVPALKNYRRELLSMVQDVDKNFPVELVVNQEEEESQKFFKINTLEEFEKKLSNILSSEHTKQILTALIMKVTDTSKIKKPE